MVAEPSADLNAGDRADRAGVTTGRGESAGERLLVEFGLGDEHYGVDIADIREIIRYQAITAVPGTPEIVEGIINLRGRVTPIVDLRKRLGLHTAEVDDATRIIVIELNEELVGVHVDAVTKVVSITSEQLQQLSAESATEHSDYLEGVADIDGRLIVLINLQQALKGEGALEAAVPQIERAHVEVATNGPVDAPTADVPMDEPAAATSEAAEPAADRAALPAPIEVVEETFEAVQPQAEPAAGTGESDSVVPAEQPARKKPAAKKAAAKKAAAKKAAAKKPAAKKPAAKKPAAKKPAAKPTQLSPAASKSRTGRRAAAA